MTFMTQMLCIIYCGISVYHLPVGIVIQTHTETQSTNTDTDSEENECSWVQLGIGSRQHRSDTVMMRNGGVVAS